MKTLSIVFIFEKLSLVCDKWQSVLLGRSRTLKELWTVEAGSFWYFIKYLWQFGGT